MIKLKLLRIIFILELNISFALHFLCLNTNMECADCLVQLLVIRFGTFSKTKIYFFKNFHIFKSLTEIF